MADGPVSKDQSWSGLFSVRKSNLKFLFKAMGVPFLPSYSVMWFRNLMGLMKCVFQNDFSWILRAIKSSLDQFRNVPLDVRMVSYGKSNPVISDFVKRFR